MSNDDIWQGLNERQQAYIQAIYYTDQQQEKEEKQQFSLGYLPRKAEVWRWIDYYTRHSLAGSIDSALKARIRTLKLNDEGTGSTFNALESRGFITCRYVNTDRNGYYTFDEAILSLQITKAGRKLVRDALKVKPTRRKPGELTEKQQAYADKIIDAGLAPREEVEQAFREKQDSQISAWGSDLTRIRKQQDYEYRRTHPDTVHCAYCGKEILVYYNEWYEPTKKPARNAFIEYDVAGIAWDHWSSHADVQRDRHDFYACCPEHEEIIMYAKMEVSVKLVFDTEDQQRIASIQYPVEARVSARRKLGNEVRLMAWRDVAEADEKALVATRKKINTKAQQSLDVYLAAVDQEKLTDNLERFNEIYLKEYVAGYKDALKIRADIDGGEPHSYQQYEIWKKYIERREQENHA